MKRIILCCLCLMGLCFAHASAEFIRPIGRKAAAPKDWIGIETSADLAAVASNPAGQYILLADVTMDDAAARALENMSFSGIFNGNGHTITLDRTVRVFDNKAYGGLFPVISGGAVENLRIAGTLRIDESDYGMSCRIGGVAGKLQKTGRIVNCVVSLDIFKGSPYKYDEDGGTGGIAGEINISDGAYIEYCRHTGFITSTDVTGGIVGKITGKTDNLRRDTIYACINDGEINEEYIISSCVGGIVGLVDANIVSAASADRLPELLVYKDFSNWQESGFSYLSVASCANTGRVHGNTSVGGIVGEQERKTTGLIVINCLNTGIVGAGYDGVPTACAGIVALAHCTISDCISLTKGYGYPSDCAIYGFGSSPQTCIIYDCYHMDGILKGTDSSGMAVYETEFLRTAEEMKKQECLPGLDFENDWALEDGMDHPWPAALLNRYNWIRYSPDAWDSDVEDIKGNIVREEAIENIMNSYAFTDEEIAGTILCFAEGYGAYPNEDKTYKRSSALLVVWKNGEIVFSCDHCSTYPDQPFNAGANGGKEVPTTLDGKYTFINKKHNNDYPALNVYEADVCRLCTDGTKMGISVSINIHVKNSNEYGGVRRDGSDWVNSAGCLLVGAKGTGSNLSVKHEFARLGYLVGFAAENPAAPGYARIATGAASMTARGVVIINRAYGYAHVPEFRENLRNHYTKNNVFRGDVLEGFMPNLAGAIE